MALPDEPTLVNTGQSPPTGEERLPGDSGSSALPVGFQLGDFRVERVLGEGGFGIVYLARDMRLERAVAIKEFMPISLAGRQPDLRITVLSARHQETFDLARRSFINEAKLLAHFDHPSLVKVLQFWEDRGTAYMAMPYYQGMTLKQWLRTPGNQPNEAFLRKLLTPVIDALSHLHGENCFHRDIAPDNIMLLPDGQPLLIDFGAARMVIGDATQALTVILKPGFAPIEQYADTVVMKQGAWTDIYALAAVMYYVITGRAPPPSVARIIGDDMVPAVDAGRGRYSPAFLAMVDACLAVRPADRPQTAEAVRKLLQTPASPAVGLVEDDDETIILAPKRAAPLHPVRTEGPRPEIAPDADDPGGDTGRNRQTAGRWFVVHSKAVAGGGLLVVAAAALMSWAPWQRKIEPPPRAPDPGVTTVAQQASAAPTAPASQPSRDSLAPPALPTSAPPGLPASQATLPPIESASGPAANESVVPELATPAKVPADGFDAIDLTVARATRRLEVALRSPSAVVGGDVPRLTFSSPDAGYVYVFMALPRAGDWQMIFPNKADAANQIAANATWTLPRAGWSLKAAEPVGTRRVLVLLSERPRVFESKASNKGGLVASIDVRRAAAAGQGAEPAYLGVPQCETGASPCGSYAAARVEFSVGPRPVVQPPPPIPHDNSNAKQCADLLTQQYQQFSLGGNTADIAARRAKLGCR